MRGTVSPTEKQQIRDARKIIKIEQQDDDIKIKSEQQDDDAKGKSGQARKKIKTERQDEDKKIKSERQADNVAAAASAHSINVFDEPVEKRRRTEESTDETCVPAASAAVGSAETERAQHPELAARLSDLRRFVEEHVEILRARPGSSLERKLKRKAEEGALPGEKQWCRFLMDNTARFTPAQKAEITALFDHCRSVAVVVSVRT